MIVFYFQHRGYGGVPSLIVNFIRTLHALNIRVKLFNYENDVIDTALKKMSVNNYELIDLDKTPTARYGDHITADDVLLVTNFYMSLQYFFKVNPRLFFYNVYPDSLAKKSFHRRIISSKERNRKLVQDLQSSNRTCGNGSEHLAIISGFHRDQCGELRDTLGELTHSIELVSFSFGAALA